MTESYREGDSEHAKQRAIEERAYSNQKRLDDWGKTAIGAVVIILLGMMGWVINTTYATSVTVQGIAATQSADRRQIQDNTSRIVVIESTRYTVSDAERDRVILQDSLNDIKEWMRRLDARLKDSGQ